LHFITLKHTLTQPAGILWTRDRTVAETSTCTTHNIHKRKISMPTAVFEPAIPASDRPQIHALGRAATEIGHSIYSY